MAGVGADVLLLEVDHEPEVVPDVVLALDVVSKPLGKPVKVVALQAVAGMGRSGRVWV